jgi:uncharacterized protein
MHPTAMAIVRTSLLGILLLACTPSAPRPAQESPEAAVGAACVGPGPRAAVDGARNVLGSPLAPCPSRLRTGFHRDGYCNTGPDDVGVHVVCAEVTEDFLRFTRERGNDLSTPRGEFPGLTPGDAWCLCASRYQEAAEAGVAPNVYLASTDEAALRTLPKATLDAHAASGDPRNAR